MTVAQQITRWIATQHVSDSTRVANGVRYDSPADFVVQVTPMSQRAVVDRLGYDLDQPYLVFVNISDVDNFGVGDLIDYDNSLHKIVTPVEKFMISNAARHGSFIMQRQQYQFSEPS